MVKPIISVIVPAYNVALYIAVTLESVKDQSFHDWECIIVNDGSTDDTKAIVKAFVEHDSRFRLVNINNSGVCVARNIAVSQAKGKYIFPLDGDDYIHQSCLERCLFEFRKNANVKLVYPEAMLFGEQTGLWNLAPFDYPTMLRYNMIDNSSMYLKEDFERVGGYRTNMIYGHEDWDFFIALLENYSAEQVVKIHEPLFYYRTTTGSRGHTLYNSDNYNLMLDNIVYNNFHIYRRYFPDIHSRVTKYDFHVTMLEKLPIKLLSKALIKLSYLKKVKKA